MKKLSEGFTLIELLVVISIIALLSSVVLSSLNTARARAGDSAVKADMKQLLSQSQNYLDTSGAVSFGTASNCTTGLFADSKVTAIINHIQANSASGATVSCSSSNMNWAVMTSALKGGGTWCIDNSQGWFKAATSLSNGQCQ